MPAIPAAKPAAGAAVATLIAVIVAAAEAEERRVPFCEPCAMGYSCPLHDPREPDPTPEETE